MINKNLFLLLLALIGFSVYKIATMPRVHIDWNNVSTWGTYSQKVSVTESDWEEIPINTALKEFDRKDYKGEIKKALQPKIKPGTHAAYTTNEGVAIKIPNNGHYLIAGVYNYGTDNQILTVDASIGEKYNLFQKPEKDQLLKIIVYRKKPEGEKNVAIQKNLAKATTETHR